MIPKNITEADLLSAIEKIDSDGIPNDRHSVKWSVEWQGNLYPPKYLISIANISANGIEHDHSKFSGGPESNDFLRARKFNVVAKSSNNSAARFNFDSLKIGQEYDRPYLAELWGYKGFQAISKGVVTPANTNTIILFVTKEKQEAHGLM